MPGSATNVVAVSACGNHSIAVKADGSVIAWGDLANIPSGLPKVAAVASGGGHYLALVEGGPTNRAGPAFIEGPLFNKTALVGSTAEFRIKAVGTGTLNYEWRYNDVALAGQDNCVLRLTNVQPAQAGRYSIIVSNGLGSSSRAATLKILPYLVESVPQNASACVGGSVTFQISVQSAVPLTYQWSFNGIALPGATDAALHLDNLGLNQSGTYTVTASNAFGSVVREAVLTVSVVEVGGWGGDFCGQAATPTGLSNVVAVAGGYYHSLALRDNGTVVGWGYNASGQADVPTGLANVVAVAGGWGHSLALKADGTVVAWGDNSYGQASVPSGLTNAVAIAAGWGHSLALKADGRVTAWGWNAYGQGSVLAGLYDVVAIAAGHSHNVAVKANGTVTAWGYGALGETNVPIGLSGVTAAAAGWDHTLALLTNGSVVAWGWNAYGQTNVPAGLINVISVGAGREHSLALLSDGAVVAWGGNSYGQTAVPIGLPPVMAISGGGYHSLALLDLGRGPALSAPTFSPPVFRVNCWTLAGRRYSLEAATSLTQCGWATVMTLPGHGSKNILMDTNATSHRRFYRVRVD